MYVHINVYFVLFLRTTTKCNKCASKNATQNYYLKKIGLSSAHLTSSGTPLECMIIRVGK